MPHLESKNKMDNDSKCQQVEVKGRDFSTFPQIHIKICVDSLLLLTRSRFRRGFARRQTEETRASIGAGHQRRPYNGSTPRRFE